MDTIPPLMIGAFVEAHIQAREIENVMRISRDHLRQGGTVWVMEHKKLTIRNVDIVFQDADYAYIRKGLAENDQVIVTDLSTVVEGSDLRTEGEADLSKPAVLGENEEMD